MRALVVDRPGILALIQDSGRRGVQHAGLTEGGAADLHAYYWANRLLANEPKAACVEILVGQFAATFMEDAVIAVTGADLGFSINGQMAANWCTHKARAGDQIRFPQASVGLRAYLAVAGGWQTPVVFGSRSVVVREGIGGLHGGPLKAGDQIPFAPMPKWLHRQVPEEFIPDYSEPLTLKVVPGYQYHKFAARQRQRLVSQAYQISPHIDRMGYRLQGPPIAPPGPGLISEGIALGAIQVPGDGQPIILLQDRQTIGGYPKLGCVTSLSCSQLSQRGPGVQVSFEWVDVKQAQMERVRFEGFFRRAE